MERGHDSRVICKAHMAQSVISLLSRSYGGLQGDYGAVCSSVAADPHFTFLIGFYAGVDFANMIFNRFCSAYW